MDVHNGPSIYNPKSLQELLADLCRDKDAQLFAGGTDIMRKECFYPNPAQKNIINLDSVSEFSKVLHSERFIDVGPMVTISQLLSTGSLFLSKSFSNAIECIGTAIVRNKATIGGAICSQNGRSALACYLSAVGALVELRTAQGKGRNLRIKSTTRWLPVSKLYESDGSLIFSEDTVITKIRIPAFDPHEVQVFKTLGSVYKNPSSSVSFALTYSVNQRRISTPQLFITFPSGGFFSSLSLNEAISGITLPILKPNVEKVVELLEKELNTECPQISELQLQQAKRILSTVLNMANSTYLAG